MEKRHDPKITHLFLYERGRHLLIYHHLPSRGGISQCINKQIVVRPIGIGKHMRFKPETSTED